MAHGRDDLPSVVFAHANGYPPAAYRGFFSALQGVNEVWAVEHRPLWQPGPAPKRLAWQRYADDLLVTVAENFSSPIWLVGHSMGAVCSILAARRAPARFIGVVALDPVLLLDRWWWLAQLMGRLNPNGLSIVKRALNRPSQFQSVDAAFKFYRGKRVFQRVADRQLMDYVVAGHEPMVNGGVALRWSGAWEACVYRSAPRAWRHLRQLKLPTLGVIGDRSDVIQQPVLDKWRRIQPHASLVTLPAGHLLPLEVPDECAQVVGRFIARHEITR